MPVVPVVPVRGDSEVSYDAKEFLESLFRPRALLNIPLEWMEDYEERAGILEFDGGYRRLRAEDQARQEIIRRARNFEKSRT